jgi:hypothetical protein
VAAAGSGWWWEKAREGRLLPSRDVGSHTVVESEPAKAALPEATAPPERKLEANEEPPKKPASTLASRFARRGMLRGVVRDPDGKLLAGAHVWAILSTSHEPEVAMPEFGTAAEEQAAREREGQTIPDWIRTDSRGDGSFEIGGLSRVPGWVIGAFEPTVGAMVSDVYSFDHDHDSYDVDVRLMRGSALRGTVRDEEGKPIGGAVVYVYSNVGGRVSRTTWVTRQVEDMLGTWDTGLRCAESLEVECVALGYVPTTRQKVEIAPRSNETVVDLTLKRRPGVLLRGRIVDPTGLPIDLKALLDARFTTTPSYARSMKAQVRAISSTGSSAGPAPGVAPAGSSEGKFDLVANQYEIVVDEDFHGQLEMKIAKAVVGSVPLDLPARAPDLPCDATKIPVQVASTTFKVRFVDAETKQSIDLSKEPFAPLGSDASGTKTRLRSDSDPAHGLVSYGCEPGFLHLEAEFTGYALSIFILDVPKDPSLEPTVLEVPRAVAGVRGIVTHADGRPFAKESLSIFRVAPQGLVNTGRVVVTNPDGEFEFDALAKGDHVLVASGMPDDAPVAVRFAAADPFPEIEVRVARGPRTRFLIRGKPTTTGAPVPSFRILDRDGVTLEDLHRDWDRWSDSHDEIVVPLQRGHYAVVARREGFGETRVEFDVPAPGDAVEIPLEPLPTPPK